MYVNDAKTIMWSDVPTATYKDRMHIQSTSGDARRGSGVLQLMSSRDALVRASQPVICLAEGPTHAQSG